MLLLSSVIIPSTTYAAVCKNGGTGCDSSGHNPGSEPDNNTGGSEDEASILFNNNIGHRRKLNGYIALNKTYTVGSSNNNNQYQGQGQYQGQTQGQAQYQAQGQYQGQAQYQAQGQYQGQAQHQNQTQYQGQGQRQYQAQPACNNSSNYSFQSQFQQNSNCQGQYQSNGQGNDDQDHANKNGGNNNDNSNQDHANKNGGQHGWKREIFYCLGTDFLSLTFGRYANSRVKFNNNQVMECQEGEAAYLNSNGQLSCEPHPQNIAYSTKKSILYIHASKILAVKGECTSPKGQISPALTLFQRHSIYVEGSQMYSQRQTQQPMGQNIILK